jgi:hypothetical protein
VSGRVAIIGATTAAVALLALYLTLGGADYEPSPVADPCAAREWRDPGDPEEIAEQFFLSALDGAACELGVSREELAPALATAVQAGLVRAVDDAEAAGALPGFAAGPLREGAERLPVDEALKVMTDVREFISGVDDLLGGLF